MRIVNVHRPMARNGFLVAGLSCLFILAGCSNDDAGSQQGGGIPPAAVVVERALAENIRVRQDYAGRARGAREVEVRARIQGILEERNLLLEAL